MNNRNLLLLIASALSIIGTAILLRPDAFATQDFSAFFAARSTATQPLGSGDRLLVLQGGADKYLQANLMVDTTSSQSLTHKTFTDTTNVFSIRVSGADITGTMTVANGGTGLTTYNSGGIPCATGATTLASSAAPAANLPMIWGGAGVCPAAGAVSGNTTKLVSNAGATPNGQGGAWDSSGNWIASSFAPFTNVAQTWTATQTFGAVIGTVVQDSTANHSMAATDCGKTVAMSSASANTFTLLNTAPIGCTLAVLQQGAGQTTVTNASTTFNSADGYTKTALQWAVIGLTVDTNAGGVAAHYVLTGRGV